MVQRSGAASHGPQVGRYRDRYFRLGLFFFLIRWLQINPFGLARRYWLWLSLLALVVLVGYTIWDYKAHYRGAQMKIRNSD